jgi:hypothetical protein
LGRGRHVRVSRHYRFIATDIITAVLAFAGAGIGSAPAFFATRGQTAAERALVRIAGGLDKVDPLIRKIAEAKPENGSWRATRAF